MLSFTEFVAMAGVLPVISVSDINTSRTHSLKRHPPAESLKQNLNKILITGL